ncbi:hypothetical protein BGZ73_000154 [Actinomortierella ambigua]|nr:hypothetical protein BGZ73_000154 [Actinomortierella ambigua]
MFDDFWTVLQDVDSSMWVIDPERPTRRDCSRRCVLANHCSIQITIDPFSPRSFPDMRLFGPEAVLEPFKATMAQNVDLW